MSSKIEKFDWKQVGATLLAVVIGGAITMFGNYLMVSQQTNAEIEVRAKEQKTKAYMDFLNNSDSYGDAAALVKGCLKTFNKEKESFGDANCVSYVKAMDDEMSKFQDSINAIYIYGSPAAVKQSQEVAKTLPGSNTYFSFEDRLDGAMEYDHLKSNEAYRGFNAVACRELPAQPRDDCR